MRPDVETFGKQAFALCVDTYGFLMELFPRVEMATEFPDDTDEPRKMRLSTLRGYYDRMLTWLSTVKKLNEPKDVQAVSVAARTLLELSVDVIIAHFDASGHPFEKIWAWDQSAKLKHVENYWTYMACKVPHSDYQAEHENYYLYLIGTVANETRANRTKWWGKDYHHPGRWTGRQFLHDVELANDLFPEANLYEFYKLEYDGYCWDTHGSGLAGFRSTNTDYVPARCSKVLWEIHAFAFIVARFVLDELGVYLEVEFNDFQKKMYRRVAAIEDQRILTSVPTR